MTLKGWWSALLLFLSAAAAAAAPALDLTVLARTGENAGGSFPLSNLILATDGHYYGATDRGGNFGAGVAFRFDDNGTYTVLATFDGADKGGEPRARLLQASDGNFYGTTYNPATVFRLTPDGSLTTIAHLGRYCGTALIQASDGNLYGTTQASVFRMALNGQVTVLGTFPGVVPPQPPHSTFVTYDPQPSELVQASDGNLYGRTLTTFFRVSLAGELTTLTTFDQIQSTTALAPLVEGLDGALYGISPQRPFPGGNSGTPIIQQIELDGTVKTFASFDFSTASFPDNAPLLRASDGSFYGTTIGGGANSLGSVFRVIAGRITTIGSFDGTNGLAPVGGLIVAPDGEFRGATGGTYLLPDSAASGPDIFGTLYRVTHAGDVATLHMFQRPLAALGIARQQLFQAPDGIWYGSDSGLYDQLASVFRLKAGEVAEIIATDPTLGNSFSTFVLGSDGAYYATTQSGGAKGDGSIVRLTPDGVLETIFSFSGPDGSSPRGPLLSQSDGSFYGTTYQGGANGDGTLFRFLPGSGVQTLVGFDSSNGAFPSAPLIAASDGNIYGTTPQQAQDFGTIFRLNPSGQFATLARFNGDNGSDPEGPLMQASDAFLYGTTLSSTDGAAVVYRIDLSGQLSDVAELHGDIALGDAYGGLIEAADGALYGTTSLGGTTGYGTIFRVTKNGAVEVVHSFGGGDGGSPMSGLVAGSDGAYYGVTQTTAYRVTILPPQVGAVLRAGSRLEIGGQNLTGATAVTAGGVAAESVAVDTPTHITATYSGSVPSGPISVTTPLGTATFDTVPAEPGPLLNISTRAYVGNDDQVMIGGFIITGSGSKKVLIRGLGPSLIQPTPWNPWPGTVVDPMLELHDANGGVITNDNWQDSQADAIRATGIPPPNDNEAAILQDLAPGAYTAILRGKQLDSGTPGSNGIGLVEIYDLDPGASAHLANISTRGLVQTGDNVMIGGFIVGGQQPAQIVVRAIGPSLPVDGTLADPSIELHDDNGNVFTDDNWRSDQQAEITATKLQPSNDSESAIAAQVAPGNYTAVVRGVNNTTGVGLVEIYKLDAQ